MPTLDLTNNKIKNTRALVYQIKNDQSLFLLTQEPSNDYTIPGGCKDLEDPDLFTAIKRELNEELNLTPADYEISQTDFAKEYENLYEDPTSERYQKNTIIYLFIVKVLNSKVIKVGYEIKGCKWFNQEVVATKLNSHHMKELFEQGLKELLIKNQN